MRRAFGLADLAASVVVTGVLVAIAFAGLGEQRRQARLGEDLASLKLHGAATSAYAADYDGAIWALTWEPGETYMILNLDGELEPIVGNNELDAKANQAVHLIRTLDDRIGEQGMPLIANWVPTVLYSHLPLVDYLAADPLARWSRSAADEARLQWRDDPIGKFDQGHWLPLQPDPTPQNRRWPYSAGFQPVPAIWDVNQSELGNEFIGRRCQQGGTHRSWTVPGGVDLGQRTLADVAYAANKVHVYDTIQRHFGPKQHYFGVIDGFENDRPLARIPLLMFDGSASVRASAEANPGWRPNTPTFPCMTYYYDPVAWEPRMPSVDSDRAFSHGLYRWTRAGLKGIDFGGVPLDTGQAEPGECDF